MKVQRVKIIGWAASNAYWNCAQSSSTNPNSSTNSPSSTGASTSKPSSTKSAPPPYATSPATPHSSTSHNATIANDPHDTHPQHLAIMKTPISAPTKTLLIKKTTGFPILRVSIISPCPRCFNTWALMKSSSFSRILSKKVICMWIWVICSRVRISKPTIILSSRKYSLERNLLLTQSCKPLLSKTYKRDSNTLTFKRFDC